MNKILIFALMFATSISASAAFKNMKIIFTNGESQIIDATGLVITVDDNELFFKNTLGNEAGGFDAANLSALQFDDGDAGVNTIEFVNSPVEAFGLNGTSFGEFESVSHALKALDKGVYVLKNSKNESLKIVVR